MTTVIRRETAGPIPAERRLRNLNEQPLSIHRGRQAIADFREPSSGLIQRLVTPADTRSIGAVAWLLVAALAVGVLVAGWSGVRGTVLVGIGLAVVWVAAFVLIATDIRDVDGFMDCWPGCTVLQETVGFAFFASPVMLVILLVGSLAGWLKRRARH